MVEVRLFRRDVWMSHDVRAYSDGKNRSRGLGLVEEAAALEQLGALLS